VSALPGIMPRPLAPPRSARPDGIPGRVITGARRPGDYATANRPTRTRRVVGLDRPAFTRACAGGCRQACANPAYSERASTDRGVPVGAGTGNDAAVFAELAVHLDRSERRITVCGEIDFAAVPVLADAMYQLIDLQPGDSTIDLAGVSFIAAAGLGCLVGFANQLANSDAKITVVGASDRLPANSRSERRHPWFVVRGMPERVKHATERRSSGARCGAPGRAAGACRRDAGVRSTHHRLGAPVLYPLATNGVQCRYR